MQENHEIRLKFTRFGLFTCLGNENYYSEERLRVSVRVRCDTIPTYAFLSAIIDTGALFSTFPHAVWSRFEKTIEFVAPAQISSVNANSDVSHLFQVKGVGAKASPCRLGLVPVSFTDGKFITPEVKILAQFVEPGGLWSHVVLGLGGKAIGTHTFLINHTPGQATFSVLKAS